MPGKGIGPSLGLPDLSARSAPRASVHLVRIGDGDPSILEYLAVALEDSFSARCHIEKHVIDPAPAWNAARGQFLSTALLGELAGLRPQASDRPVRILGVAAVDLFIPILTFVFGQAQIGGPAALLSVHRLRQEFYGYASEPRFLLERTEKEALHELGHTFGLLHCPRHECVMHFSNSIEEVDLKPRTFCRGCAEALGEGR